MKITKIEAGKYKTENGYIIKSNACMGQFTGRMMKANFWYIYDTKGNRIDGGGTLKEAKQIIERKYLNK